MAEPDRMATYEEVYGRGNKARASVTELPAARPARRPSKPARQEPEPSETVDERVQLVRASTIPMTRVEFVEDLRIPRCAVTLMVGRGGLNKTTVMLERGARLTRGQLRGAFYGRPTDVVYVGMEDDPAAVLVPRLAAAGADLERVHLLTVEGGYPFEAATDLARLDELLGNLPEPSLVIIDPLDAHLGGKVDTHRKSEVQAMLGRVGVLTQEHRIGAVGIGHLSKGDASDFVSLTIGSVGFTTSVRALLGVGEHPDDPNQRLLVLSKANLVDKSKVPALRFKVETAELPHDDGGTIETARVVWLGEVHGVDPDSVVRLIGATERTERDEAVEWLRETLEAEPMRYRELEKLAGQEGITRSTLHRAKRAAGVEVMRDQTKRGRPSVWALGVSSQGDSFPSPRDGVETKSEIAPTRGDEVVTGVRSQPTSPSERPTSDCDRKDESR